MKKSIKLEGVYPALITAFAPDGSVDVEGIRENIRFCLDAGVAGVVALGSTGEAVNLSGDERERIVKAAVAECKGRAKVIVGTGAPVTSTAVAQTKDALAWGADAALVLTPFNNIPNRAGLIKHYEMIDEVGIPIILYNIPAHTGVEITIEIFDELIQLKNVIGMKESSGNLPLMADVIRKYGADVTVFTGCDDLTLPIFSLGAKACILALAAIAPKQVVEIFNAMQKNDLETAREGYLKLLPVAKLIGGSVNFPAPVKEAVKQLGRPAGDPRIPITPCTAEEKAQITAALTYAGLL
jgi:4-hydroxy-tetrahydrodipicolinate synthase